MSSFNNSSVIDSDTAGDLLTPSHRADIPSAAGKEDFAAEHVSGNGSSSNPSQSDLSSRESSVQESNVSDTRTTSAFAFGSNPSQNTPSLSEVSGHADRVTYLLMRMEQSGPSGTEPRRLSKMRKELFSKIRQFHSATGKSAAAIVITPSGDTYACGAPSVDSVFDRYLNVHDTAGDAINMTELKQLLETPVDDNEDLEELLRVKQKLEAARERILREMD